MPCHGQAGRCRDGDWARVQQLQGPGLALERRGDGEHGDGGNHGGDAHQVAGRTAHECVGARDALHRVPRDAAAETDGRDGQVNQADESGLFVLATVEWSILLLLLLLLHAMRREEIDRVYQPEDMGPDVKRLI